ncbi:glycosyltransferase family 2 protein [Chryseobacterium sp. cx-311]|uniref:glycosyltransferase family 2 protein n=1 Tax=Marnyiella aurantia TaxID=2758037 RepID=UPI001AE1BE5F|nr:glycosyltransferase family 2 protein [Marnyiella aurantia]MBP0612441.1 glycosyltransferase family 2 protein [Marnyiella aurantia]
MELSVIIVNYNVTRLLEKCLLSLQRFLPDVSHEVIVIDNASPDSSWKELQERFPDVRFIASDTNLGFSRANNLVVQQAHGNFILILNPDTELDGVYMKEILTFARAQPDFGCLGVRMHDAGGNFLPESKRDVPNMVNSFKKLYVLSGNKNSRSYYRNDIAEDAIAEVQVLTGAFLLMKKEVYLQVGGLDERYFMYGEDIDLCYSVLRQGYRNWYYGKYSILHHKGQSTVKDDKYLQRFYGAMQLFIEKYYRKQKPFQYRILQLGLTIRFMLEKIRLKIKAV